MKGGGDEGPAIVPGSADTSLLWQRISEDEMPGRDETHTSRKIRDP